MARVCHPFRRKAPLCPDGTINVFVHTSCGYQLAEKEKSEVHAHTFSSRCATQACRRRLHAVSWSDLRDILRVPRTFGSSFAAVLGRGSSQDGGSMESMRKTFPGPGLAGSAGRPAGRTRQAERGTRALVLVTSEVQLGERSLGSLGPLPAVIARVTHARPRRGTKSRSDSANELKPSSRSALWCGSTLTAATNHGGVRQTLSQRLSDAKTKRTQLVINTSDQVRSSSSMSLFAMVSLVWYEQ